MTNLKKDLNPEATVCRDLWAYPVIDILNSKSRVCCHTKQPTTSVTDDELDKLGTDIFLNTEEIKKKRLDLLTGTQTSSCSTCWFMENNGLMSHRLGKDDFQFHFNNQTQPGHKFVPFSEIVETKHNYLTSDRPNKLDIILGNHCDLKCVYCCEAYSSQWYAENLKYGEIWINPGGAPRESNGIPLITNVRSDKFYSTFLKWFDEVYHNLERIAIMGGEPTSSPTFPKIIDHLIQRLKINSHPNCTITIITNLNWKKDVTEHIQRLVQELPNVKISLEISMESVGKKAEYIRSGVIWDRFVENFDKVAEMTEVTMIPVMTVNALCISSILDYLKFLREKEIRYNRDFAITANLLIRPMWFQVYVLNNDDAEYAKKALEWLNQIYPSTEKKNSIKQVLQDAINAISSPKNSEINSVADYFAFWLSELDKRRNTHFTEIFPEFAYLSKRRSDDAFTDSQIKRWI